MMNKQAVCSAQPGMLARVMAAGILLTIACTAGAQIKPSAESLSGLYPGKAYSPYAERNFPDRVFCGSTSAE